MPPSDASVDFELNGTAVSVPAEGSLLDALREHLGVRSAKDGCSPQGQCGCCTVWIDGQARVSCVTPVARARGRTVTTVEGLPEASRWAQTFTDCGASQCGFCTPGIIMRVAALDDAKRASAGAVGQAMLAHLCRCTGWQSIVDAVTSFEPTDPPEATVPVESTAASSDAPSDVPTTPTPSERRAAIEGGVAQSVGPHVALGAGGFADDTAPSDALVAVLGADGEWVVGESLAEARRLSGKVQGRRTTAPLSWPIELPHGDWVRTLQTTWVEPAYLEPDASWCRPASEPVSAQGNGGAFGGKADTPVAAVARRLADQHGRPVRVLMTREDVVRRGAKRPPLAAGLRADGSGVVRVARTAGIVDAIGSVAPGLDVVEVDVEGPPTSTSLRGAGWVEAAVLLASLRPGPEFAVEAPNGAVASAAVDNRGAISARVRCGSVLDDAVLRSYCVGAAHMALGWVTSEGVSVDGDGVPHDLTIRSFGVLRAVDTPQIDIDVEQGDGPPVNGSDAVFAAVAAAVWHRAGWPARWPTGR